MAQVLLVVDQGQTAVVVTGTPPTKMAAWLLDVPDGSDALAVAADFANSESFPVGTRAYVVTDLTSMTEYQLQSSWAQVA